ncbi:MAG: hypothetical protein H0V17_08900 [Deltaproteobacteria bacterium]|nr:hypothetical protein [Deltaproteobacteria bacterium]
MLTQDIDAGRSRSILAVRVGLGLGLLTSSTAYSDDKELDRASVIYARGDKLYKSDSKGKGEVELVALPSKAVVRALRTDAKGTVLLADLNGKWWWMPLDGSKKSLVQLPCGEGPAQLPPDGSCVLCRSTAPGDKALVVNFSTGKLIPLDVPATGARIFNVGLTRRVAYSDATGVWSIALADPRKKTKLAPEPPLRAFLPSPDGSRAVGVYKEPTFEGRTRTDPVDTLVTFALDGQGARRKGIRNGVPLEWSQDSEYVLVQDGPAACLMRTGGGQYKCWKGFTAVSIAPDGSYALVLGNRDISAKAPARTAKPAKPAKPAPPPTDDELDSGPVADDVPVALPSGPLALYRARLDGPYDAAPVLVAKIVDGAAVWIPGR